MLLINKAGCIPQPALFKLVFSDHRYLMGWMCYGMMGAPVRLTTGAFYFSYMPAMFVTYNIAAACTDSAAYQCTANAMPDNAACYCAARATDNGPFGLRTHFLFMLRIAWCA